MGIVKDLRERVWLCNRELPLNNLVVYTFGNVSGIDRNKGYFAIKPSGVPYADLTAEDMVIVDLDNQVVEGHYKPSSDTATHALLYRAFPQIGGIVHTHSAYATAWAQARRAIPCFGTTHADHVQGEVPCTDELSDEQISGDYETETGNQIVQKLADLSPEKVEMVLVANHGPFTWGKSPEMAVYNMVILEDIAQKAALTLFIDPNAPSIKQLLIDKHYLRKHGKEAYYGQK